MKNIIDLSTDSILEWKNINYFNGTINQLYRPCWNNSNNIEFFDIAYSWDSNVNKTKFFPILLKERFYLINIWWYLVIEYYPNEILNPLELEDELWKQFWWKYDILCHKVSDFNDKSYLIDYVNNINSVYSSLEDMWFDDFNDNNLLKNKWIFVLKKNKPLMLDNDSIDKWSFWIVSNWDRDDRIIDLIKSIDFQKIPNYEINICWKIWSKLSKSNLNFKYIKFNKRSSLWWLDKKKNILIENSKYENIIIIHDRYYFYDGWYEWMKKWWNNFEHITCRQLHENNMVKSVEILDVLNPCIIDGKFLRSRKLFFYSKFKDEDFSVNHYIWWWVQIFKKSIVSKVLYNETLFWQDWEDVWISNELNKKWHYARLNPYSVMITKRDHIEKWPKLFNIKTDFDKIYSNKEDKIKIHSIYMYIVVYLSEKSHTNFFIKKLYNFLKYIHSKLKINKLI